MKLEKVIVIRHSKECDFIGGGRYNAVKREPVLKLSQEMEPLLDDCQPEDIVLVHSWAERAERTAAILCEELNITSKNIYDFEEKMRDIVKSHPTLPLSVQNLDRCKCHPMRALILLIYVCARNAKVLILVGHKSFVEDLATLHGWGIDCKEATGFILHMQNGKVADRTLLRQPKPERPRHNGW
jgi:phosphohistidine phosphatase SixA